jgi:hypothetical protein
VVPAGPLSVRVAAGSAPLEYRGEAEGVPFQVGWSWPAVFRAELERRRRELSGVDPSSRLQEEAEGGPAASAEGLRESWRPLLPWLPSILGEEGLTADERLEFYQLWQAVARTGAQEGFLGRASPPLSLDPAGPGGRLYQEGEDFPGQAPWQALELLPVGGKRPRDEDGGLVVASERTRSIPIGIYADAAALLRFDFPQLPPDAEELCLWMYSNRFPEHSVVVLAASQRSRWAGQVELWHPRATGRSTAFRGWVGVRLPRQLWPLGGTSMDLVVRPLLREEATLVKVVEMRTEWSSRPPRARAN